MFLRMIRIASMLFAATAALGTVAAACSNSSMNGTYGFLGSGINGKNQPVASGGQFTATPGTPTGILVGVETVSVNGKVSATPITGTYSISSNCTGSVTITIPGVKPLHYRIVVIAGGSEIDIAQTDTGQIGSSYALAQGTPNCTNLGVGNKYGFQNSGLVVGVGPIAFTGRLVFDGLGGATGTESGSEAGTTLKGVPLSGTYVINSDCTGSGVLTPQGGAATNFTFVVVNSGKTLLAIETDATTLVTGTLKR